MRLFLVVFTFMVLDAVISVCISGVDGVEHYSLSYSYFDEIAQAYCAASRKYWTFAIRRDCDGVAPTCNEMCKKAEQEILGYINHQRNHVACYDAFHIKKNHPRLRANPSDTQPDAGVVNMGSYGYGPGGCSWKPNHCGPNYCCCRAY